MKHFLFLTIALITTGVEAGNVTVPNTFTAGTPAIAADVNANFNSLANGVNDNETNINTNTISVGANSLLINSMQSTVDDNSSALTNLSNEVGTNTIAIAGKADNALGTEVTANALAITALEGISSNRKLRVLDADGIVIGDVLSMIPIINRTSETVTETTLSYVTKFGLVRPNVNLLTGKDSTTNDDLFYTTTNCNGQRYSKVMPNIMYNVRRLFAPGLTTNIPYSSFGAATTATMSSYQILNGQCFATTTSGPLWKTRELVEGTSILVSPSNVETIRLSPTVPFTIVFK